VHELSITRSVLAVVCEHAPGRRVTRVRLEIGQLSAVLPDAIRFCFDICARGTPAEGAVLEIVEIAGRGRCGRCGAEVALTVPAGRCAACGEGHLRIVAGQELMIKEMEVESCA
jgi:hydrogenase nickel incorporation protein HypA/HybF